jgi:hypothetical protein
MQIWQENNVIIVEAKTSLRKGEVGLICQKAVMVK